MKPAFHFVRCRLGTLFLFAFAFSSQLILCGTLTAQTRPQLQLTAAIVEQNYCLVHSETLSLQVKLRLRYTNLSSQRLIVYQGHDLFYQTKLRSESPGGTPPYEVLLLNMRYFDEEFERIEASSPGKVFVKLPPGGSFERELITGIGVIDDSKERSSTSVRPGRHSLQVIVSTWYQSPRLAEKLRQQWQGKGVLWSQPLSSIPLTLTVEIPAVALPCR